MTRRTGTESREPVVVVTGPTASGKSGLAVQLALRFGGEVVNADSMQVYRFMNIGTAKPSLEERGRVAHHLFDVVAPDVEYSAGRYVQEARAAAEDIHRRGKIVFLTGGTGLYIRTFLEGLVEVGGADPQFRSRLEREHVRAVEEGDPTRLYRRLQEADAEAADRIHPNDLRRQIRALEIIEYLGARVSALQSQHAFGDRPYSVLHLAFDPGVEILAERIDRRCRDMIDAGLLQEVRQLRRLGYGPELRPMRAVGYRHINAVADGSDTLANALVAMQRDTRRFAKRQRTWLRKVKDAVWMIPTDTEAITAAVERFLSD
jgi:tRNA dimethylallyltransferase